MAHGRHNDFQESSENMSKYRYLCARALCVSWTVSRPAMNASHFIAMRATINSMKNEIQLLKYEQWVHGILFYIERKKNTCCFHCVWQAVAEFARCIRRWTHFVRAQFKLINIIRNENDNRSRKAIAIQFDDVSCQFENAKSVDCSSIEHRALQIDCIDRRWRTCASMTWSRTRHQWHARKQCTKSTINLDFNFYFFFFF